jgi:predicted RNA-binding Zn-ribbon protein involved in translation (DUF1610 family)
LEAIDMPLPLPPEIIGAALESITAWRLDHDAAVACPMCGALGLKIIDQSARPYAEWYALTCTECGLDATVHIPLAPP